ncbi:MAG: acetyl-CoA carboxylase biotin carboxyl carrier protein [Hungatella sp.]
MEFEQIVTLIKTVSNSSLTGFKYEENGVKISMSTGNEQATIGNDKVLKETHKLTEEPAPITENTSGEIVKSPLVGTFYAAASEEAEPFVSVGEQVKAGQILAIIEAMKLMNEVEADQDGEIVEILVENEDMVEFDQPMFRIR